MSEPGGVERPLGESTENELERLLGESTDEVIELRGDLARAIEEKDKVPHLTIFTVVVDRTKGRVWVPNIPKDAQQRAAMARDLMSGASLILQTMLSKPE